MLSKKKLVSVSLVIALVFIAATSGVVAMNLVNFKTTDNNNAYAQTNQARPSYFITIAPNPSQEGTKHYNPSNVAVPAGTTVVWVQSDPTLGSRHTVTSGTSAKNQGLSFDSGPIPFNGQFQKTFDRASGLIGKFPYFCTIHPWLLAGMISSNDTVVKGKSFEFGSGTGPTQNVTENNRNLLAFTPIGVQVNQPNPFLYNFTLTRDSDNKTIYVRAFDVLNNNLQVELIDLAGGKNPPSPTETVTFGPQPSAQYSGAYHVAGDLFTQTGDYTVTVEMLRLGATSPPQPMKDSFKIHVVT